VKTISYIAALALVSSHAWGQGVPTRRPAGARPTTPPCVVDLNQLNSQNRTSVTIVTAGFREPPPPPKPQRTGAPRLPDPSSVIPARALSGDITPQFCESLKTGNVTPDEVVAALSTMDREHSHRSHTIRRRIQKMGISYTYEYVLDVGSLKFYRQPGVGYCSDFDWRYTVRNVSQRQFTVFSTTGEVGLCFSPGFGLFYVPGLSSIILFPIPGLCFDDAHFTKLDLRNVNDEFERGLVDLVDLAFEKMQKNNAKLCVIGAAAPPWLMPVVVQQKDMVAYCTSTRNCQVDTARLTALIQGLLKGKEEE